MDKNNQKRLKAAGWKVSSTSEFLKLTAKEAEYSAVKLSLGFYLRDIQRDRRWTQTQLVKRLVSD